MKNIVLLFKITLVTLLSVIIISPMYVNATPKDDVCAGAGVIGGTTGCDPDSSGTINNIIRSALNLFSAVIGIIAVVMIMIGGVKYISSQGEASQISAAKNTILYAVIGLVVVAFSQIIVHFVIGRFK